MKKQSILYASAVSIALVASGAHAADADQQFGANPNLPEPQRGLLPNMTIPEPAPWDGENPPCPTATRSPRLPPT